MQPSKACNIAVTGNIGSGKSLFCKYLEELGQKVFYADQMGHEKMYAVKQQICRRWGDEIWQNDAPDRSKIAQIVFNDPQELNFLNDLLHPLVKRQIELLISQNDDELYFFEIPLLFEANIQNMFDLVVLVRSSREQITKRLMARNPLTCENQLHRLDAQMPDSEKVKYVDVVIDNDGSAEDLRLATKAFCESLAP